MKVENPELIARATPGNRSGVGLAYLKAAAWLGDDWLSSRLQAIGAVLRDRGIKKPADAVWKAARIHKVSRPDTARLYRGASLAIMERDELPAELGAWLAPRLAAMADAMEDAKPANAVYRACGAGRAGIPGNLAADPDQNARDAALVSEVEYQQRLHPELLQALLFERVARLWSQGRTQLSASIVEDAWKRRRAFPAMNPVTRCA